MVNTNSPAVIVVEKDISEYAATVESSIVGIVGYADRGPTNKATLITSPQSLYTKFGPASESLHGQALEASVEILEQSNQLYFVRAVASTAVNASSVASVGTCPTVTLSGANYGVLTDLYLSMQVYDQDGVAQFNNVKEFNIPAGTISSALDTSTQSMALAKIIGGDLDSAKVGAFGTTTADASGWIVGSWAGSGASIAVSAYTATARGGHQGVSALFPVDYAGDASSHPHGFSSVRAYGTTYDATGASGLSYVAQSLYPGAGYNLGTKTNGDISGVSVEIANLGGGNVNLVVNDHGAAEEYFKVSLLSSNFIENKINTTDTVDVVSDLIKGELYFSAAAATPTNLAAFTDKVTSLGLDAAVPGATMSPGLHVGGDTSYGHVHAGGSKTVDGNGYDQRFSKFIESTNSMVEGTSPSGTNSDIIGVATGATKTGMQALDDSLLNVSIAMVPGITAQAVQNALITLAENTQEFIAVMAPPYAVGSAQDAIDWSNGLSQTRTAAITSDYAAVYWPWVKVFSVPDGKDRWYDPAIFAVRQMALTDNVSEPWFAPAGFRRGRLSKPTDVEVRLNKGDRDAMYSGGNVVNPIVNFAQQGITVFGQRTTKRTPSALDRVNVRRLMIQLRKIILLSTTQFIFEPNDEFTWVQIEELVNPLLDDIKRRRGITEFKVVCDETTNTPLRVDRNELWCKVLLKPTKTAEVIVFEINLTNQSAQLGS